MIADWLRELWHRFAGKRSAGYVGGFPSLCDKKERDTADLPEEFPVPKTPVGNKKKRREQKDLRSCFDDDTWNSGSNFY